MKFLERYPFTDPCVEVIEGFAAYDGNLKDPVGAPHKGIDYVLRYDYYSDFTFLTFNVVAMHAGEVVQGLSKSWGRFVRVRHRVNQHLAYDTVYAHLRSVSELIPQIPTQASLTSDTVRVVAGAPLGRAGNTGSTNRLIQLHLELHRKNLKTGEIQKLDPYGLYDRFSSGRYPHPWQSLAKLEHFWLSDFPPTSTLKP